MIIAIDPGKSGAMAIKSGEEIEAIGMDEDNYIDHLQNFSQCDVICYLEEVHAMPGQGVTSMFTFGNNFGFLRGALRALDIPTVLVRPQVWQKGLSGLKGLKNNPRKRKLKEHASRLYPHLKPTLKTADALLILDYAARQQAAIHPIAST